MKKIFVLCILLAAFSPVFAQGENPADDAKQGATDHVNNNISNSVDNGLDKTEGAIKGLFKKKKAQPKPAPPPDGKSHSPNCRPNRRTRCPPHRNQPGHKRLPELRFYSRR